MNGFKSTIIGLSVSLVICSINVRRTGWLDRVVEYQKKSFINDLMKPSVKITARIEKAPPGYIDSKDWDYDSVIRLLTLIRDSEGAAPVRRAFQRALKTNRRWFGMSFAETFKAFPSLTKGNLNNFYYDVDPGEYYDDVELSGNMTILEEDVVIVVANPVEAKLPSARISVELLKDILEHRAEAGRHMPTTELNITWPVTPKRSTTAKPSDNAVESTSESTGTKETTAAPQANDTSTPSNGGNETAVNETSTT